MSATMDESAATAEQEQEQEHVHPLDEPPTETIQPEAEPVVVDRRGRGLGLNRHLGSAVLSFLGVLGAYGALDYAYYRTLGSGLTAYQGGAISDGVMIAAAVAAGCMFVAAVAGRISALGPLLAGLVLGVGPCVWIFFDRQSYVDRANDVPELWSHTSFGLVGASVVLYPVVAGLLIGTAVAGRWRRQAFTT
jgi:hypothetical protein